MSMKRKFSAASAVSQYYGAKRHRATVKPVYRKRAPQRESGFVDTVAANYALDSTGSVTLLNTVPNNTTVSSRVGKKIMGRGLQMRGNIRNGSTATTNDVAYMIVYDKRPTGSLPSISTILVSASPHALNNDANAGRFKILSDKTWDLGCNMYNGTDLIQNGKIGRHVNCEFMSYKLGGSTVGWGGGRRLLS